MLSSDKNIEELIKLFLETKNYVELKSRYLQVVTVDKLVKLLTAAAVTMILAVLVSVVIFFLSVMLASWLAHYVGSLAGGLGIVALIYALLIVLFYVKRRSWIERPLANFLGHLLLDDDTPPSTNTNESPAAQK